MEPREGAAEAVAVAAQAAAVVGFLLVLELDVRLRREEHRTWWAGNGRDLLNLLGLLAIGGSLLLRGLHPPAALLVGGALTLALFGASVLVATQLRPRRPRAWVFGAGALIALPVLLWPAELLAGLAVLADVLFPAPAP